MDVSAYSLVALTKAARPLMGDGGSILTLTYYGAEKVVANYNVMGVAKAALEACVRYLAVDLGPRGIRVNAISAGPVRTLAASGVTGFKGLYGEFRDTAPLRRNITIEDVGGAAVYLAERPVRRRDRRGALRRRRLQRAGGADPGVIGGNETPEGTAAPSTLGWHAIRSSPFALRLQGYRCEAPSGKT